jgi:type IV pilus assembly protein PilP
MKEKKTILLVIVLVGLIGIYVWYANKTKVEPKTSPTADLAQRDPDQVVLRKLTGAIDRYKKENKSPPKTLDALKGKYLDEATLTDAAELGFKYTYVNETAYRIAKTGTGAPVMVAAKKPDTGIQPAKPSTATPGSSDERVKELITTETGWKYDSEGKPDPFKPFIVAARVPEEKAVRPQDIPLTPLQKMPLSEVQAGLRAIIWGELGNKALVEDATGKGYVVKEGTYVGMNDGIVKKILEDKIIVEEYRHDPIEDRMVTNEVILKLKKGEGEE